MSAYKLACGLACRADLPVRSGFAALTISAATARSMICPRSCSSVAASAETSSEGGNAL
jgi:hypothetical protein